MCLPKLNLFFLTYWGIDIPLWSPSDLLQTSLTTHGPLVIIQGFQVTSQGPRETSWLPQMTSLGHKETSLVYKVTHCGR